MLFNALLGVHVLAGLSCVVTGAIAMLSEKRRGRHPRMGTIYFGMLAIVFATMTGMSVMRWSQDRHLFLIGLVSFALASLGYAARKIRWRGWIRFHITGMGSSYIALLTAFYVDNGPNLPVWNLLPHVAYWFVPSLVGLPLLFRALARHATGHLPGHRPLGAAGDLGGRLSG